MMKSETETLNLDIFELDSKKRHSDYFTIFLFNEEEVDRLRGYINGFIS